jgi:lipopolysaccharide export system permease protein
MAVLVAAIMAFGRLSSDNEIIALKASGVHLCTLLTPILIVAFLLALGMERFGNIVLPEFNYRFSLLYSAISRKRPTLTLEPNVFQVFKDQKHHYILLAQKIQEKKDILEKVYIIDKTDPKCSQTIIAEKGRLIYSEMQDKMIIRLFNGEVHKVELDNLESYQRWTFRRQDLSISLSNELQQNPHQSRGNRAKSAGMMLEEVKKNREAILVRKDRIRQIVKNDLDKYFREGVFLNMDTEESKEKNNSEEFAVRSEAETVDSQSTDYFLNTISAPHYQRIIGKMYQQIRGERRTIETIRRSISGLWVEIHKKYSIPVTCIIFIVIGLPLGIMVRQGGFAIGGSLGLVFFVLFWAFLIGGEQLADRRMLSPVIAMWAPNILVGFGGIYLVIRSVRESTFIPWEKWAQWLRKRKKRNEK